MIYRIKVKTPRYCLMAYKQKRNKLNFYETSSLLIKANNIFEISSNFPYNSLYLCLSICSLSNKYSKIAAHSKTLPLEITIKLRLSLLLNLDIPSAIFSMILNEALLNWSLVTRSNFLLSNRMEVSLLNSLAC